jgi:hypothetical protein
MKASVSVSPAKMAQCVVIMSLANPVINNGIISRNNGAMASAKISKINERRINQRNNESVINIHQIMWQRNNEKP